MTDGRTQLAAGKRAMLARRFAVLDLDGNGVWQRADYQRLTRRLCATFGHPADSAAGQAVAMGQRALFDALLSHMDADADEAAQAFGRLDRDRNGMVDIAELALAISQFFTSRDAGADGNLAFGHL